MPPGRPATRQRVAPYENDENTTSTRLTRAKAAAGPEDSKPAKGALQPKKAAVNTAAGQRKRAALGDVSNVSKVEAGKKATGKVGLVSKAGPPAGIQKTARPASRNLSTKEPVKKSGPGAVAAHKRKASVAAPSREGSVATDDAEPQRKKAHVMRAEKENVAPGLAEEPVHEELLDEEFQAILREHELEDVDDPLMVAEYAKEIFEYLQDLEPDSLPNPDYMSWQDDLEWKTRGILVDWLIEVHTRFHLLPETLFLAINIIDRFLSEKVVQLDRLQLVGITAMFIASKYEEVMSPHVENFRRIADNGFSEAEILSAERAVLSTLDYNLSYPNPMNFLRRVSKADNYDIQSRTIGKYLMEISLLDHRFMEYRPSHVAAGAMFLSRLMLDRGDWDAILSYYAGYREDEVEPVVKLMVDYLARPVCHEAFFKKYASKKFLKSSILARSWAKRNASAFGLTDLELSVDQL